MSINNKAIFNQQRTGKTPTTLVTMRMRNENDGLIIVPNSTLYIWKSEFEKWHGGACIVVDRTLNKKKRKELFETFEGTIITTYMLAYKHEHDIRERKPQTVAIDEAHRLRNYQGMASKQSPKTISSLISLTRIMKSRYALTGTPAPNDSKDIFGILTYLFPRLFTSYWNFVYYYFTVDEKIINSNFDTAKVIGDFKSEDKKRELQEFLELVSIQRKRRDIMQWVEEVEPEYVNLPAKKKQKQLAKKMHEEYEVQDIEALNDLDRMIKERQIAVEPQLLNLGVKGIKTEWLEDFKREYPEKRLIIASSFTSYLKYLKKHVFPEANLLIGDTPEKERYSIETRLNEGEIDIVLANIEVAHLGMKLYGADTMVFTDPSLTYTNNEQMMDRLIPISEAIAKEKEIQEVFILYSDLYIDVYLKKMLERKASKTEIINNYGVALDG